MPKAVARAEAARRRKASKRRPQGTDRGREASAGTRPPGKARRALRSEAHEPGRVGAGGNTGPHFACAVGGAAVPYIHMLRLTRAARFTRSTEGPKVLCRGISRRAHSSAC